MLLCLPSLSPGRQGCNPSLTSSRPPHFLPGLARLRPAAVGVSGTTVRLCFTFGRTFGRWACSRLLTTLVFVVAHGLLARGGGCSVLCGRPCRRRARRRQLACVENGVCAPTARDSLVAILLPSHAVPVTPATAAAAAAGTVTAATSGLIPQPGDGTTLQRSRRRPAAGRLRTLPPAVDDVSFSGGGGGCGGGCGGSSGGGSSDAPHGGSGGTGGDANVTASRSSVNVRAATEEAALGRQHRWGAWLSRSMGGPSRWGGDGRVGGGRGGHSPVAARVAMWALNVSRCEAGRRCSRAAAPARVRAQCFDSKWRCRSPLSIGRACALPARATPTRSRRSGMGAHVGRAGARATRA